MAHHVDRAVQTDTSSAEQQLSNTDPNMDYALESMQKVSGSLGEFLRDLFNVPHRTESGRSQKHAQMVSRFLKGQSKVQAEEIVDLIYEHKDASPKWSGQPRSALRAL